MNNHPPGLIGLPCREDLRSSDILPSIMALQKPKGTDFYKATGLGPADPLNEIGRVFIANPEYKWLFLTNDDNLCQPDALIRLLDRHEDVVSGLYLGKMQPFEPVVYNGIYDNGHERAKLLDMQGTHGMESVLAVGDGCLLIRRHVLEAIPAPWWEYGAFRKDQCDHDLVLCKKIRYAGYEIWCDTTVHVDHVTSMAVRPFRNEKGAWEIHLCQGNRRIVING